MSFFSTPRCAAVAGLLAFGFATPAARADVQANLPQVAGVPTSDTTARFPTNKQNEPSIAVNPRDPNHLIAGANDEQRQPACGAPPRLAAVLSDCSFFPGVGTNGVYTSADGGVSWTNRGILDDQASWKASPFISDGDAAIVYGPNPYDLNRSRAYYVGLASYKDGRSPFNANKAPELIVSSYSDDDGLTWSAPVPATTKSNPNTFNDKNSAWVDNSPSSPYYGTLYVGFTEFRSATTHGNGNAPVAVSRSTDGGLSFSAPKQLSPAANNGTGNGRQGTDIATGPDGSVYVAFEQASLQVVAISRDGGRSYAKAVPIGAVTDIQDPIPGANFRTNSFPSISADPRVGSRTLYTSWATRTPAGGRIVVSTSTDRGRTWQAVGAVSTAAEGYAFFNGMDVAPNGRVDIGYQALKAQDPTTFGTGNAKIDAYYVAKPAGGAFSTPRRVSDVSSDPAVSAQNNLARQFWGDYNTMISGASSAWFISTDGRNGAGCAEVDAFQTYLAANGLARSEEREAGQDPDAGADGDKPAPPVDCPAQFGNTDLYVARILAP